MPSDKNEEIEDYIWLEENKKEDLEIPESLKPLYDKFMKVE